MKLTVKLYAGLSQYLPSGVDGNAASIEVDNGATPYRVIDRFNIPREQAHLVLLNGVYLEPEERSEARFRDGDTLAVWPPVAGG